MKKTYLNPEISVIKLASNRSMLSVTSPLSAGKTPTSPGDSDAHGFDFDEDEEDY